MITTDTIDPLLRSVRVLLVDGQPRGEAIKAILEQSGIAVCHAASESQAAPAVGAFRPDLLIAEWDEAVDAMRLIQNLKRTCREFEGTPVILTTHCHPTQGAVWSLARLRVRWILEEPVVLTSLPKLILRTLRQEVSEALSASRYALPRWVHFGATTSGLFSTTLN